MRWHRDKVHDDHRKLFTTEVRDAVVVLRFCDVASDLLGMHLDMIEQLWLFFSEQERTPARSIVLHVPASALGPANMDRILARHGIHPDGDTANAPSALEEELDKRDFAREMNGMRQFIHAVRQTEAFVIMTLEGNMVLPLFGPALACDYRVAAEDFILVNRMVDYCIAPLGGLPWFLTQILGRKTANLLMRKPQNTTAQEAMALGLVERVVPTNRLLDASVALAQEIVSRPCGNREALKQTTATISEPLDDYLAREDRLFWKSLPGGRTARNARR